MMMTTMVMVMMTQHTTTWINVLQRDYKTQLDIRMRANIDCFLTSVYSFLKATLVERIPLTVSHTRQETISMRVFRMILNKRYSSCLNITNQRIEIEGLVNSYSV